MNEGEQIRIRLSAETDQYMAEALEWVNTIDPALLESHVRMIRDIANGAEKLTLSVLKKMGRRQLIGVFVLADLATSIILLKAIEGEQS